MRQLLLLVSLVFCISFTSHSSTLNNTDKRFESYKERFVVALWSVYPAWASSVGYHKYDDVLVIPNAASREKEIKFCTSHADSLSRFDISQLSDANKIDFQLILTQLKYTIWGINELRTYEWDPSIYNVSGLFAEMLTNDYADIEVRLHSIKNKLAAVPAYYAAAKQNINNPTIEHTELAISQNRGGLGVLKEDLEQAVSKSTLTTEEKNEIRNKAKVAVAAIEDYIDWLGKLEHKMPRSFRLGKELYAQKFELELQSGLDAASIYQNALARKEELHAKMYASTRQLWRKYFSDAMPADKMQAIKKMIDKLSENHVSADSFQLAIEQQIPELVDFIKKKNLLFIDPTKPLVVRREPAYMAGVAGASISAPGPYDKNGNTYYNVGSLEGWDKDKAESYLREYNKYILQILNIHEAIPGHYTQLVYANQSPSIIKSILGNNAMIEGWAVYTELMMLENGYDVDPAVRGVAASPEMWLMYYKWNLRSTCNTILDYSVHAGNMSKADAMNMLTKEAFQQQAEAEGKWKRATLTQVQLCCYFTGFTEICNLRKEMMIKQGNAFNLKKFHEQFLSYGNAPVKYIRDMMLK